MNGMRLNDLRRFRERQGDQQPAQILAFSRARPCRRRFRRRRGRWRGRGRCPGLPVVSSRLPRVNSSSRSASAMPGPSSSIWIATLPSAGGSTVTNTRPWPYLAAFSTRLPSISSRSCRSTRTCGVLVAGDVDGDVWIEGRHRPLDRLDAFPHGCPRLGRGAAADRPGAGQMVVDLPPHHRRFADHRVVEVGRMRGGGIGDDGQRRLQRMGEVAGMAPRFLGLRLAMGQQLVDLVDQRLDLAREILGDAGLGAAADGGHFAPHAAQRPQAVNGLQRGEDEQAGAERGEAANQGRAKFADLPVDRIARLGDLEAPADVRIPAGSRRARGSAAARLRIRSCRACAARRRYGLVVDRQPPVP